MLEQLNVLLVAEPHCVCRIRSGPKQLPHNKSILSPMNLVETPLAEPQPHHGHISI